MNVQPHPSKEQEAYDSLCVYYREVLRVNPPTMVEWRKACGVKDIDNPGWVA